MQCDAPPLQPTWCGHVATTADALILFEACLQGRVNHLSRRPYDRERLGLIRSGNVFVYEEYSSGIKRWTDGRHWSPSRVLGNFLVYRELRNAFQPGTTRKVAKPRRTPYSADRRGSSATSADSQQSDAEYALIGPLVDSYPFKPGGLVKKIIRIVFAGVPHHLVAYYTLEDVESGRLSRPGWDPVLCDVLPRPELVFQEGFRMPVDQERDHMLGDGGAEWFPADYQALGPVSVAVDPATTFPPGFPGLSLTRQPTFQGNEYLQSANGYMFQAAAVAAAAAHPPNVHRYSIASSGSGECPSQYHNNSLVLPVTPPDTEPLSASPPAIGYPCHSSSSSGSSFASALTHDAVQSTPASHDLPETPAGGYHPLFARTRLPTTAGHGVFFDPGYSLSVG